MDKTENNSVRKYRVLCLVPHRTGRSPGQRFRFEQYLEFLGENGYDCTISNLISEKDDLIFYKKKRYLRKFLILHRSVMIRKRDLKKIRSFDMVFIYREAIMHWSVYVEKKLSRLGIPFVYDFDDAIWLFDVSDGNRTFGWLKRPGKIAKIIELSRITIAGNEYLASYARQFTDHVTVIPTTIQTESISMQPKKTDNQTVCIGWTGSTTTMKHLKTALPFLKKITEKYPGKITIKVISDSQFNVPEPEIHFCKWNPDTEIEDLNEMDIGIMPLPDDDWSKGKCGFKGLQYMSLGIPAVMSPVGVNTEIISDGENGFLAAHEQEWIEKLSLLIESPELREKLGKAGKKTVEEKYSFEANKHKWLEVFQSVTHD